MIKLNTNTRHEGNISKNRKESSFYREVMLVNDKLTSIMQARFYGNGSNIYCCIWINDTASNTHLSGGGKAGGYGYHKASAAFAKALSDSGIENKDISCVGDTAIEQAMRDIAVALGYEKFAVFTAHA